MVLTLFLNRVFEDFKGVEHLFSRTLSLFGEFDWKDLPSTLVSSYVPGRDCSYMTASFFSAMVSPVAGAGAIY